jgi:hypothetical protein
MLFGPFGGIIWPNNRKRLGIDEDESDIRAGKTGGKETDVSSAKLQVVALSDARHEGEPSKI